MKELESLREEINRIDPQLVALFEERMEVAGRIAQVKEEHHLPVKNKEREGLLLHSWEEWIQNKDLLPYLRRFFENMMEVSCSYQMAQINARAGKRAVYMGVPGSNGEEAALSCFNASQIIGVDSFEQVLESIENGVVPYGFLPIENSTTGSISEMYDLLISSNVHIVGEVYVDVCHALLVVAGTKIGEIEEVYSHPQGFSQCKEFLQGYPNWKQIPYFNTAISAKYVSEQQDNKKAAIASPRAAEIYGLDILENCINTGDQNRTRFLILSKNESYEPNANKVSLSMVLPHVSGSLFRALEVFQKNGLNLLKIESRPIVDRMGEYRFFIDFEGNLHQENTKAAIEELRSTASEWKLFGNYMKADEKMVAKPILLC